MVHSYSRTGNYNISRGKGNQDAVYDERYHDYEIIALADGVSQCAHSAEGAALACRAAADMLMNEAARLKEYPEEKLAYLVIEQVLYVIERTYGTKNVAPFASTLMFAMVECRTGDTILFNLGDGAVFKTTLLNIDMEIAPRTYGGIPAQTTARRAYRAADIKQLRLRRGEAVILCSDGFIKAAEEKPDIMEALEAGDYSKVDSILDTVESDDDMSYIVSRYR